MEDNLPRTAVRGKTWYKVSKVPANHEPAPEFTLLRMTAVAEVAVFLTFVPLPYTPYLLDGGDVSPAFQ